MTEKRPVRAKMEITVSWTTLLKLLVAALLVYLTVRLWALGELLFLAILIAITLWPIVQWTRKRGWPKWSGPLISAFLVFTFITSFLYLLIPTVTKQGAALITTLPTLKEDLSRRLPAAGPIRTAADSVFNSANISDPERLIKMVLSWGTVAFQALIEFFVLLIVAVYFLVDGERIYNWLLAFFSVRHRKKIAQAAPEVAAVISNYMMGQFITSIFCGMYVFTILTTLHVPDAALLALIAAVFDVLPMIGFFLSIIPAIGMAMTVSPVAGVLVTVLYSAYHMVENYLIVPRVYGNQLRLSTLTVLVSCLAGGWLAGVVGAICILPVVASYPIIERIWLRPHLEADTVAKHDRLEQKEHPGT